MLTTKLALLAPLILCACKAPPSTSDVDPATRPLGPPPPPAETAVTPSVPPHMQKHFAKADEMKRAFVAGDLPAFNGAAVWMAEHELSKSFPPVWKTHVDAMQLCAKDARDAKNVAAAAKAFAYMGQTCANCHQELGVPKLSLGEPPAEGSGAALRMVRHQWAADRMWEGLFLPSEEAWNKGADVLADAPLAPEAVAGKKSVPPEVEVLANRVHVVAQKARSAPRSERQQVYADILATCAGCHQALAVKPK